jgi:hypothetical protein
MLLLLLGTIFTTAKSQTTLTVGDIAFTGYNSDQVPPALDTFSFVIARVGGISNGTVISFTDNGWLSGTSALATNEGTITWTCSGAIAQGVQVKISANGNAYINNVLNGSCSIIGSFSLAITGDQVFAYQGASTSPTFIAGIHMNVATLAGDGFDSNATNWDGTLAANGNRSARPPGLTTGSTAIWFATEVDNARYKCTTLSGTASAIATAVNTTTNWDVDDINIYLLPCAASTSTTISSISRGIPSEANTNATSVTYNITFGASVTGLSTSNFNLTTSGVSSASVTTVSGSGSSYSVVVNTGTGNGNITLNLANATGISPGISTTLPFAGETYTIDKTLLPISIEYFKGSKQSNGNLLDWKVTCLNSPTLTLLLERSADGRNFKTINTQSATENRCLQSFSFTDATPLAGVSYYRLKTIDIDGKINYSTIVALLNRDKGFEIVSIMPNPVATQAMLSISSAQKSTMEIIITDLAGKQLNKQRVVLIAGSNNLMLNLSNLAAGTYQITGVTDEGERKSVRFVKE